MVVVPYSGCWRITQWAWKVTIWAELSWISLCGCYACGRNQSCHHRMPKVGVIFLEWITLGILKRKTRCRCSTWLWCDIFMAFLVDTYWYFVRLRNAGFPVGLLPRNQSPHQFFAGPLRCDWKGMRRGVPVSVAMGDLQCSFVASLENKDDASKKNCHWVYAVMRWRL